MYLRHLKDHFLLGDDEAKAIFEAAKKRKSMAEVEDRSRHMQSLIPAYLEAMALMAAADGNVTEAERHAVSAVVRNVGDLAVIGEHELEQAIDNAFRHVAGKDPDREVVKIANAMVTPSDRYWCAVYMMIIAIADGCREWRRVWLLGGAQEALKLSDQQMDQALASARLFPISGRS